MYQIKPNTVFNKTLWESHCKTICRLKFASSRDSRSIHQMPVQSTFHQTHKINNKHLLKSVNQVCFQRKMSTFGSFLHRNWPWLFKEKRSDELSVEEILYEPPAPTLPLSDTVFQCVTTEQLLNISAQEQLLTPKQYSVIFEQLFNLAYSESLPYLTNSTSLFEFVLRGREENEAIVARIRDTDEFQILIQRVQACIEDLDKSDVVTCLYGLTYLLVPESTEVYQRLCVRLLESSHTGYSLADLNKLHLVMFQISCNSLMYYQSFFPKMNKWFEVNKTLPVDKEGLRQLIYIFTQWKYKSSTHPSIISRCINHLEKVRKETSLLSDPDVAILLLEKMPNLKKESNHMNQLEAITDAAVVTVEKNLDSLTPFDINSLSYFAFHSSIIDTKPSSHEKLVTAIQRHVVSQIISGDLNALEMCSLLTNNFSQLTHRGITSQERAEIKHQLHNVVPNASFFSLLQMKLPQQVIRKYELEDILVAKISENIERFDNIYAVSWLLKMLTTEILTQNPKLHAQVEQMLAHFYKTNVAARSPLFQLQALTYFMSRQEPMPASLQLAYKFAETCATSFDRSQLMRSLNLLRRLGLYLINNHKLDNAQVANGNLYRLAVLNVYISVLKMLGTVLHTMNESDVTIQRMISLLSLISQIKKEDPLLTQYSASTFESLVQNSSNKNLFLSLQPRQVESLLNQETGTQVIEHLLSDETKLIVVDERFWYLLRLVSRFETSDAVNQSVQWLITRLLMHDFEEMTCFDQVRLLSYCTLYYTLPLDPDVLDTALKSFFTHQKLQEVDKLLSAVGPITRKSLQHRLYYLNMYTSFKRQHVGVPWFHDQTHIAPAVVERNAGVGDDLTAMFGGQDFVKSKVNIGNGFIAWKMALFDEKMNPVEFRPDNFLYSKELGLDRVCFSYITIGERSLSERSQQPYVQLYFDVLAQHVDKSILVYDHEWLSLGCSTLDDKLDLVMTKIDDHQSQSDVTRGARKGRTIVDHQHGAESFRKWAVGC